MKEDETFSIFMLKVDEVVNHIQGLGESLEEKIVVKKVLRSLPRRFDPKITIIEEDKDLNTSKLIELYGTLTTFEMRFEMKIL